MQRNTITRKATLTWLEAIRLPLTAAERLAKRAGQEKATVSPAAAFGNFEVAVKDTVGRITGDETLTGLARLQREEIRQRMEAAQKTLEAEAARTKAQREADHREAALERQRNEVERRAAEREAQLERERVEAKRAVADQAAKKESAVREQVRKTEQAVDKQAAVAEAERLRAEADALRAKERAVTAQGAVLNLDKAVKTKKAIRKNG